MAGPDLAYVDKLRALVELEAAKDWTELRAAALRAAAEHPDSAQVAAFVAHAMRQLGELEPGYEWAVRGLANDADNLFARNRLSLLANLTGRFEEAYAAALPVVELEVANAGDAQNLAVTIVNAIYAAHRLDRIAEAVERFSPAIARLDHPDLHYNSACLYALAGDDRWYAYTAKALEAGKPATAFAESDFDRVRGDPRFAKLLARDWKAEVAALQRARKPVRDELVPEDFVDFEAVVHGPVDGERHLELEAAIDTRVDELDGYLVYSDWWQSRDNPRGMFVLACRRCDEAVGDDNRMLAFVDWAAQLHAHAGAWLGALAGYLATCRATWRLGFVRDLELDVSEDDLESEAIDELVAGALDLPACRFVRSLGFRDMGAANPPYEGVIEVLRRRPLASLRHLESLSFLPEYTRLSWTQLDLDGLAHPTLGSLAVGATELSLAGAEFPRLRRSRCGAPGCRAASSR